ncbi:MAG: single-stranded-DNA-specific exonuclease RecJ [Chitinophagaceae bacterium]
MEKRWSLVSHDPLQSKALQESLRISPLICQLLTQRGITSFEEARQFFRPELEKLHDPWLMKDMHKATSRIVAALQSNEKILVYGDYDVDGTTAVASFYSFLRGIHQQVDFYIPHRYREGYGISQAGIDFAAENGFTLMVALDCGIKSVELIAYAKTKGIDFIVCDHHLPDQELPAAVAILNPKQPDCAYPYKELCGCGVGFKLMTALTELLSLPIEMALEYLDLVATAIAADIVPITGENRILAFHGLRKANQRPNNGIKALGKLSGISQELHIHNLVFMIAPRVNAAGRMDDARKAVEMFVAQTEDEAAFFASQLHQDNSDRKEADLLTTREALELIKQDQQSVHYKSTVLYQPHWHKGVVGIVASRVIEHYHRPTIILTKSGEVAAGSARSVPGFNLYEAIHACREHLLGYGGHFAAAGMTLDLEKVDAFREHFEKVVSETILPEQLIPEIRIDAEVRFDELNWNVYNILTQMEPFGPGNDRPVFMARALRDTGASRILKEQHLRASLRQGNFQFNGIGFGLADKFELLSEGRQVDVVFKLDVNEWNNEKNLQLRIVDIKPTM